MRKTFVLLTLLIFAINCSAQIRVSAKIDTSKKTTLLQYQFIKSYMNKDVISKDLWHPKYKNKEVWDYSMDWIWGAWTPKKICAKFDIELVELQQVDDTLSYFKITATSDPKVMKEQFTNVYKFYVVKHQGQYYLDNCKDYDNSRFAMYKTKNINFYSSPFYHIGKAKMNAASLQLERLNQQLQRPAMTRPIDYYLCATEEELNNLSNIVVWNGGLGGYTNIPERFIVAISDNPDYQHEFVHALLGPSAHCFFLQEGMASLYGGIEKGSKTYDQGIAELKACYAAGNCTFEKLYARDIDQKFSSSLTYTFAAACCKYLIDNYGLTYFYKIYYNKAITTENFMEQISSITGKSQTELKAGIEKLILK